jgi:long-chain acyl-CoA synthetase
LDLAISGGAALDPGLAERWELLGVTVLQGYGATEASPIISGDRPGQRKPGAVGRAYPSVKMRMAADGEVMARGASIFPGYWRNPDATARALEGGWYHTGDLGAIDADGYLYLKGRKKDMIVLANGQNVYPEDVENALHRQAAIQEAVVVGWERAGGAAEVHAVLLMHEPKHAAEAVVGANQTLAEHQRIQGWTIWTQEDFPRTYTLKVKKHEVLQALASADTGAPLASKVEAPRPQTEDPLTRIIVETCRLAASDVRAESRLGDDLNLDSLGRVELLSAIEEELGAYLDEAAISATTTVADLQRMIAAAPRSRDIAAAPSWPRYPAIAVMRELILQALVFPFYRLFYDIRVERQERITPVRGPAMIAVNHNFGVGTLGLDPPAAWLALPLRRRLRTATAGEEHSVFDQPIKGRVAAFFDCFPLSKEGNVRGTLEQIGRLLDGGWSVLIFPEGKLTVGGPIQPFMRGTGMIAVEAQTPVIPMRIIVERSSILEGRGWPWRGALTMRFADPLQFAPGTDYGEATARIEQAIRGLRGE